jgi:hypothetical protein
LISFSRKLGARLRAEVGGGARFGQQGLGLRVVEELLLLWRAAPAPEQHFLGDDLVVGA